MRAALLSMLLLAAGCAVERHHLSVVPGADRVIRVQSGDRFFFDLPEPAGSRWTYRKDDADVDVIMNREPGKVQVVLRVHRGYDGPSTVDFRYRAQGAKGFAKSFTITLYRRTGDTAFWE